MKDQGWDHSEVKDMIITLDMSERKKQMFAMADAIVALPGGIGTLEELTEAITLKQLGLFKGPIIILNTLDFYKSFVDFLEHMISGNFLRPEHKDIWKVVSTPEEVLVHITKNESWLYDALSFAKI